MKPTSKRLLVITILMMEFNSLAMAAVSPALADIGRIFPDIPQMYLSMLSTVPALICIPIGIIATEMLGKRVTAFQLGCLGSAFLLSGGLLPAFCQSFWGVLAWRIVFGMGMGILSPLGSALLFLLMTKEEAEIQSASDAMANSLGAVVYQLLGGFLCARFGWRGTFSVYLLFVPTMAVMLWGLWRIPMCRELFAKDKVQPDSANIKKQPYGWRFWGWCALYALYCVLFYPLVTDMAAIVLNNGYGMSDDVSVILSLYTLGGILGGFLYRSKRIRSMDTKALTLVFLLNVIGFSVIMAANSVPLLCLGATIFGVGYGLFTALIVIFAGYSIPKELRVGTMARILVFTGIGEFSSAFIMEYARKISGSTMERFPFLCSIIVFFVLMAVYAIKPKSTAMEHADEIEI